VNSSDPRDRDTARRPLPPRLDPRAGSRSGEPRGGRSRLAATARILAAVLAVVVLGSTGWGWYLERVAEASVNRSDAIPTDGNSDTSGQGAAMNLLLVGDDSRANLSSQQQR
jgi:hypothetical protein